MRKVKGGHWIQDPITGKLISKDQFARKEKHHMIMKPLEAFISPITKELITDRSQLRMHNKRHGVTNSADYSPEFMKKRSDARENELIGNTRAARSERLELINQSMRKYGV